MRCKFYNKTYSCNLEIWPFFFFILLCYFNNFFFFLVKKFQLRGKKKNCHPTPEFRPGRGFRVLLTLAPSHVALRNILAPSVIHGCAAACGRRRWLALLFRVVGNGVPGSNHSPSYFWQRKRRSFRHFLSLL